MRKTFKEAMKGDGLVETLVYNIQAIKPFQSIAVFNIEVNLFYSIKQIDSFYTKRSTELK